MSISRSFAQRKTNSFVTLNNVWLHPQSVVNTALAYVVTEGGSYTDLCGVYVFNSAASLTDFQTKLGNTGNSPQADQGETLTDMGAQFTVEVTGTNDFATYRLVKRADYTNPDNNDFVGGAVGYIIVENNFSADRRVKVART